ncbi:MAG: DUF4446 family protein [Patescibacteria group bacterium]|nr:DUF4446 family protein [Patescibacteria group bacterium]
MIVNIILAVFFIWILILTIIILKLKLHYYNLISRTKKQKIDEILDQLIMNDIELRKKEELIKKKLENEINKSRFYFQKISLVRFNPFGKRGNEQSFVLALLDSQKNGIVINFIYTPDGLRVYPKKVKEGKGVDYDLADEEKKAIEKAD